ncbi:MAG: phytanoyl-CoA dioxygenase family protein [Candidatus Binatia bacterium]
MPLRIGVPGANRLGGSGRARERVYFNPDGSPKRDIRALEQATPGTSAERHGVDPGQVAALLATLHDRGYVVLPELVPRQTMAAVRAAARPFLTHDGRNEIEGYRTRRIYSVIEKTLACNPLVEHPLVLALLDQLLMPNYLLSQLQVIDIHPGEVAQPLHHDDGFYPFPRPRPAISAATIWAVDDFTEENGATLVLPGSHRWDDRLPTDADRRALVPAVMPSGSAIFFLGTLWHGAGANRSGASRLAATAQYCQPWARQQENYSLAISRDRARLCSERIRAMLGYSMLFPFIGFVNGRDPKRLLD